MIDVEPLIKDSLSRIYPQPEPVAAWDDVVARAKSATGLDGHRRADAGARHGGRVRRVTARRGMRYALAAAVVLLAAVITAVAFGWPRDVIDFLTAPSAPRKVQNSFGAQNVEAPHGMSPQAIPGKARRIMAARFDATGIHPGHGGWHVLYVAPTRKGGFCYQWTHFTGTCFDPTENATNRVIRAAGPIGVTWMGNSVPKVIVGYVRMGATKTVEVRFADGGSVAIPVTWVSAPIDAGFFLYVVPPWNQAVSRGVVEVAALNGSGTQLGVQKVPTRSRRDRETPRTLPDGTRVSLPAAANVSAARKLISFRATNGSAVWLWVMPFRGGGTCFVFNQGSGCSPTAVLSRGPAFAGGLSIGSRRVLFFAHAKPTVVSIELRYQDGSSERVVPIEGYVLHEIAPSHYEPGNRLVVAVGLDAAGLTLLRQAFRPETPGVYPCKKPVARGYGVKTCP